MQSHQKIALGLSGGVDSAVTAVLLKEQGYEVNAFYLECWNEPGCRAEDDRKDALKIALQLEIPFKTLDFKKEYKQKVMQYFLDEYKAGKTPNPDVMCNKIIKFGMFYDWAIKNGFDAIATGHYAQTDGEALYAGLDEKKDQTYFLYQIRKEQLQRVLFPIGGLTKSKVRLLAKKHNLHVANKKDSVGICFVGDINVPKFLEENLGKNPGPILDWESNQVGSHQGLWFYTIGQRHGFDYDKKKLAKFHPKLDKGNLPAMFVTGKNIKDNTLIIGPQKDTLASEFETELPELIDLSLADLLKTKKLMLKIRNTGKLVGCEIIFDKKNQKMKIKTKKQLAGIAVGQSAVFYLKQKNKVKCLGGAIITNH